MLARNWITCRQQHTALAILYAKCSVKMKPSSEVYFAWILQVSSHFLILAYSLKFRNFGRQERTASPVQNTRTGDVDGTPYTTRTIRLFLIFA